MNRKIIQILSILFLALLPAPSFAQCNDMLCQNLETILDAALTDFREYRLNKEPGPDVSLDTAKIPCQMSTWANNVPMYICYGQVSFADAQRWYARTIQVLQSANPSWHFQINSPGDDHYVDAGPVDCEVPPTDGPYIGQCPVHLQVAKQGNGTAKVYLLVNSLTSPYLLHHVATAPTKAAAPVTVANGCDDTCQNLKKAFESRTTAFEDIRKANADGAASDATVKLEGAKECTIKGPAGANSAQGATQFVCYWRETSGTSAETRYRDLIARMQVLIPSTWSTRQGNELDDSTGADMEAWYAVEPGGKHDVRVYLSAESVGLHIRATN
jgi:hypothetical protein